MDNDQSLKYNEPLLFSICTCIFVAFLKLILVEFSFVFNKNVVTLNYE